jgi:hypothetical protein
MITYLLFIIILLAWLFFLFIPCRFGYTVAFLLSSFSIRCVFFSPLSPFFLIFFKKGSIHFFFVCVCVCVLFSIGFLTNVLLLSGRVPLQLQHVFTQTRSTLIVRRIPPEQGPAVAIIQLNAIGSEIKKKLARKK